MFRTINSCKLQGIHFYVIDINVSGNQGVKPVLTRMRRTLLLFAIFGVELEGDSLFLLPTEAFRDRDFIPRIISTGCWKGSVPVLANIHAFTDFSSLITLLRVISIFKQFLDFFEFLIIPEIFLNPGLFDSTKKLPLFVDEKCLLVTNQNFPPKNTICIEWSGIPCYENRIPKWYNHL